MYLTLEALRAAASKPLPFEQVEVPELGGFVYVRALSGTERDEWEKSLVVIRGRKVSMNNANVRARFLTRVICDDQGTPLLKESDASWLGNIRADVLSNLYEVGQRLSGVTDKDLDELGKDSAPTAGSGSPTS